MHAIPSIKYITVNTPKEFDQASKLFTEYAASLGVDLSFQHFEEELQTIDVEYNKSNGALILAYNGAEAIACAGIRKFEDGVAELKRMYVKPEYRGQKISIQLLERAIKIARQLGYKKIRLDTLHSMTKAQQIYRTSGFYEISAYRFNPLPGTIYMEKMLE
ncbi:MAG: GNAT family N-acetyltransferase [Flavipsychrobacter sp.]